MALLSTRDMKRCTACKKLKHPSDYHKQGEGLKAECKPCSLQRVNKLREARRQEYFSFKKKLECEYCGFDDYRALDFDHKNPDEKSYTIGQQFLAKPFPEIMKEIEKCRVLCANCHRIKTFEEK